MEVLVSLKNEEKALQMEKYMKNLFLFAGVPEPERTLLQQPLLDEGKHLSVSGVLASVHYYYEQVEREYQYVVTDLVQKSIKRFTFEELVTLLPLVQKKEWWDSIDSWRKVYSTWCKVRPEQRKEVLQLFEKKEDFWLRRVAITLQLGYKQQIDTTLLIRVIDKGRQTKEFFIQKVIGWALRDCSKTDAVWVKSQLTTDLTKLASREASKYL